MTDRGLPAAGPELRSLGPRKGRKPSPRQARLLADVLPRYALDLTAPPPRTAAELFEPAPDRVWLEIGFGGGEHLVWQADRNPAVGHIGAEPFVDGVIKLLSQIEARGLTNVRIWPDDVRALLRWLPAGSLDRVFVLFPDPWPKARHRKRRLIGTDLLDLLSRVMRPGAELRVATDIGDYARTVLAAISVHADYQWRVEGPSDWRLRADDWPATRYEAKAAREGRRCYFLTLVRR
mgnify:CR=1 FL=1